MVLIVFKEFLIVFKEVENEKRKKKVEKSEANYKFSVIFVVFFK